jgi:hypothetical protein
MFRLCRRTRGRHRWAMTNHLANSRVSMPGRVRLALAVLVFQGLANGFIGFIVLDAISTEESHGAEVPGAGLIYFIGYLSIAIGVTLLLCAVLTPSRFAWVRVVILLIEAIGIISGAIGFFSGQLTAFIGVALAIGVVALLNRDDSRNWYGD